MNNVTAFVPRDGVVWSWTFEGHQVGAFFAMAAAEGYLKGRGFSIGPMQGDEPRGIMFGNFVIAKWRDLTPIAQSQLHGKMIGNMRHGPVTVQILRRAPQPARNALAMPPFANVPSEAVR